MRELCKKSLYCVAGRAVALPSCSSLERFPFPRYQYPAPLVTVGSWLIVLGQELESFVTFENWRSYCQHHEMRVSQGLENQEGHSGWGQVVSA